MNRFVLAVLVTPTLSTCLVTLPALAGTSAPSSGPDDGRPAGTSGEEADRDPSESRRNVAAEYTVRGRRYHILDSAEGFRERGIASWYGSAFHGRETASGEPFDMHALTAAHPHLPLQSVVRVSDVGTGASVIVRVNDRGPFADDRVIDLSRAAARQLGMLESGTTEVTVEALGAHSSLEVPGGAVSAGTQEAPSGSAPSDEHDGGPTFVQLGAFADRANADALAHRVRAHVSPPTAIDHDTERALYRVRVGPIEEESSLSRVLESLSAAGIDGYAVRVPPR